MSAGISFRYQPGLGLLPAKNPGGGPTGGTGVYLFHHEHRWEFLGGKRWPVGTIHPVYRCMRCGDVINDLSVEVDL